MHPRYARCEIKNDQPGSHDFQRFPRQFLTDFLEILQRLFFIEINISRGRPFAM